MRFYEACVNGAWLTSWRFPAYCAPDALDLARRFFPTASSMRAVS